MNEVKPGFTPRRMLVWDVAEADAAKRIVVGANEDGSYEAVAQCDEATYLERGICFTTAAYNCCKELPSKRPMTNAEMRGKIANELGIEISSKTHPGWSAFPVIGEGADPRDYLWRTISPTGETGPEQEFEVEE